VRVLMVSNYFVSTFVGGAEVSLYNTALGLREAGHEVRILAINTRGNQRVDRELSVDGLAVHEVNLVRQWKNRVLQTYDPGVAAAVREEITRSRPDVIHTHNLSGTSLAPYRVAAQVGVPLVATLHDHWLLCANNMLMRRDHTLCSPETGHCNQCFREYDYWAPIPQRRRVFRYLARHVHTFVSPSQCLIDLHVLGGYERERFRLLRYGLHPLPRPPVGMPPFLSRLHVGAQTMVYVAALVISKGVEVLIRALPRLIESIPHFRLAVAGRGPAKYEEQLRSFGEHVTMLGAVPRSHIVDVFAGAGLAVLPSIWYDNAPLSISESLMAGTPVLGSRIGGIPEMIIEGETGYLCEPNNPDELSEMAIAHFNRPVIERRAMRRACMIYGEREFAVARHIDQLLGIYRAAMG
jgi:glycosyltransferase involved in cell wall biosynthesis